MSFCCANTELNKKTKPINLLFMLINRVLAQIGSSEGNLLIVSAGIHGNEIGAITAISNVAAQIQREGIPIFGKFVALLGNMRGITEGKRFIDKDLNRMWHPTFYEQPDYNFHETQELIEMSIALNDYSRGNFKRKYFADFHATSAKNGIFVLVEPEILQVFDLTDFVAPVVIANDNMLKNTLLRFMTDRGFVSVAFEGGQIGSQQELDNHTFFLWQMLKKSGLITDIPDGILPPDLKMFVRDKPRFFGFDYVHKIEPKDQFVMRPGFENFSRIVRGCYLADTIDGQVLANQDGYLLMPLYQPSGTEGFFIISERFQSELK